MKKKRIVNKDLIEFVRTLPCIACYKEGRNDAHHVKTKGSGGDDVPENLLSLCRTDHQKIHKIGLTKFAKLNSSVYTWLTLAGWVYENNRKKWVRNKN